MVVSLHLRSLAGISLSVPQAEAGHCVRPLNADTEIIGPRSIYQGVRVRHGSLTSKHVFAQFVSAMAKKWVHPEDSGFSAKTDWFPIE